MRDTALLQLALGLTPPWTVSRSDVDPEARRLDIEIDFVPGSPCQRRRENASARRSKDASMTNAGKFPRDLLAVWPDGTRVLVCPTGARRRTRGRMSQSLPILAAVRRLEVRLGRAHR